MLPQSINYAVYALILPSFWHSALDPDPVENLKIYVDPCIPSVTLTWAPPQNSGVGPPDSSLDVSRYLIRFRPRGAWHYKEITVDGSTTSLVLKRESGLTPHTTSIFEVRAESGDNLGQWKTVSAFVGKLDMSSLDKQWKWT